MPPAAQVRDALDSVLSSDVFARSERARDLLRYLVTQDLAGHADRLKGFSIAVDVFGKNDKFDPATNLRAWLFTILRNTFYSTLRKRKREVADSDGAFAATMAEAPVHDGRLAYRDFRRAFDQLSPEHREVLILVGASGFSGEEAAEMMGVAVGTVKSRASRARRRR